MKAFSKACAVSLSVLFLASPALADPCAAPRDMAALETAVLQQRLMVAALTCNDVSAYNTFVLSFRGELQASDATLLAFFRKQGSEAGYHAYKTHLANGSEIASLHDRRFCARANTVFRSSQGAQSLAELIDSVPAVDTGFDACYREARADVPAAAPSRSYDNRDHPPPSRDAYRDNGVRW